MNVVLRRIIGGTKDGASNSGNTHEFKDELHNEDHEKESCLNFKLLLLGTAMMGLFAGSAMATSIRAGSKSGCSEEFIGIVKEIKDSGSSLLQGENAKVEVTFEVNRAIKGFVGEEVTLKLLKFGPDRFEEGSEYQIQMNHGWFCNSEKL